MVADNISSSEEEPAELHAIGEFEAIQKVLQHEKFSISLVLQKLVIDQTDPRYGVWSIIIIILSSITCFSYPYVAAFGFEQVGKSKIYFLLVIEFLMMFDIILSFFTTFKVEGDLMIERDFYKIAMKYLKGKFAIDVFLIIPFGLLADIDYEKYYHLELLWLLKLGRIPYLL